jgi:hypothetical protein
MGSYCLPACKLIVMSRTLAAALLSLALCAFATAQSTTTSSTEFHWLGPRKDAALFDRIKAAFADELKPDDPEKVKPVAPQLYKKITRIGVFQSSALVLIAERETPTYTYGDYFQPFNYNLNTGKKEPFEKGFTRWHFNRFAHFEPSKMPDIVFSYLSCTECEATYLLSSFRFDSTTDTWSTRKWSEKEEAIMIGSDTVVGSEEGEYDYQCLFKIADFDSDGFDDLAVRCLAVGEQDKILEDTTNLYTIQQGKPKITTVNDPNQVRALTATLCENVKKSKLCSRK